MPHPEITNLLDLSGQVAIVTGASRGIGKAIAEVFAAAGARLALIARTPETLQHVADDLREVHGSSDQETILAFPADISDETQVNQVVAQIMEVWNRIDILVNNAGQISAGPIGDIDPDEWRRVIDTNLTGTYFCSRAVATVMEQQKRGRIINITSITAQTGGVSGGIHYSASKGGMTAFTKTLARDLAPFGVTVNAIAPGQIDTDPDLLTPETRERIVHMVPLGRLGHPKDIAYVTLFLATPMAAYITGATIDVNGGILKR